MWSEGIAMCLNNLHEIKFVLFMYFGKRNRIDILN